MGRIGRQIDSDKLRRLIFIRALSQAEFAQFARLSDNTISSACMGGPISPKSFRKITVALRLTADRVDADPDLAA